MDEMWKKMERAAADKLMRKALWRKALQRHPHRASSISKPRTRGLPVDNFVARVGSSSEPGGQ